MNPRPLSPASEWCNNCHIHRAEPPTHTCPVCADKATKAHQAAVAQIGRKPITETIAEIFTRRTA